MSTTHKILLAGPWVGEFGWELFCWQGFLRKLSKQYDKVITIEEQNLPGGIGSIISEIIADNNINVRLKRFGINDKYILKCGNRDWLKKKYGLDDQTLYKNIKNFCDKKNFI